MRKEARDRGKGESEEMARASRERRQHVNCPPPPLFRRFFSSFFAFSRRLGRSSASLPPRQPARLAFKFGETPICSGLTVRGMNLGV